MEPEIQTYTGPEKLRLHLDENGLLYDSKGNIPYHTIIPRGLLNKTGKSSSNLTGNWHEIAPQLEQFLQINYEKKDKKSEIYQWLKAAKEKEVLTFSCSMKAALQIIHQHLHIKSSCTYLKNTLKKSTKINSIPIKNIDLWFIKEGHTSSIWHITFNFTSEKTAPLSVCLNVGRDIDASNELSLSFLTLQDCYDFNPDGVVKVLYSGNHQINLSFYNQLVTYAFTEWVDGVELHLMQTSNGRNLGNFIEVGWFIQHNSSEKDNQFNNCVTVLGRKLGESTNQEIWKLLLLWLIQHSQYVKSSGKIKTPCFEINDGDFVRTETGIVVVGLSATQDIISSQDFHTRIINYAKMATNSVARETSNLSCKAETLIADILAKLPSRNKKIQIALISQSQISSLGNP